MSASTSKEMIIRIRRMKAEGVKIRDICEQTGVSVCSIYKYSNDITAKRTKLKKEEIIKQYTDGVPITTIMKNTKCSFKTLKKICEGVKQGAKKPRKKLEPDTINRIIQLRESNHSIYDISVETDISSYSVANICRKAKVSPKSHPGRRKKTIKHNGKYCRICNTPLEHNWFYCPEHHRELCRSSEDDYTNAAGQVAGFIYGTAHL